jgi:hypothetical protein
MAYQWRYLTFAAALQMLAVMPLPLLLLRHLSDTHYIILLPPHIESGLSSYPFLDPNESVGIAPY